MLVKSFLTWMDGAPIRERVEAVAMLARAYLLKAYAGDSPGAILAALTSVLDDPSPMVRRALAMAFAERADAPRHIVLALAADQPEVSGRVLAHSPHLTEADLMDLADGAEGRALVAIALRRNISHRVAEAIVNRADLSSTLALAGNAVAEVSEAGLLSILDRFGHEARIRETILARGELPASVRHRLMLIVASGVGGFVTEGGFLTGMRQSRVVDETIQRGTLSIAHRAGRELAGFVGYLRRTHGLTPALLLRSVLGGNVVFLSAALAELCGMEPGKVAGMLSARSDNALTALMRRAGIPVFLEPVLVAAARVAARLEASEHRNEFALPVIHAAQAVCISDGRSGGQSGGNEQTIRLLALLRRYESEAARMESRRIAVDLKREIDRDLIHLAPVAIGAEMLRLSAQEISPEVEMAMPEVGGASITRPRRRGLILDEPIPDLRSLIDEWKAEHAARDAMAADLDGNCNENIPTIKSGTA
jgi:uncharacterized protein (DUF2336 family)